MTNPLADAYLENLDVLTENFCSRKNIDDLIPIIFCIELGNSRIRTRSLGALNDWWIVAAKKDLAPNFPNRSLVSGW